MTWVVHAHGQVHNVEREMVTTSGINMCCGDCFCERCGGRQAVSLWPHNQQTPQQKAAAYTLNWAVYDTLPATGEDVRNSAKALQGAGTLSPHDPALILVRLPPLCTAACCKHPGHMPPTRTVYSASGTLGTKLVTPPSTQ